MRLSAGQKGLSQDWLQGRALRLGLDRLLQRLLQFRAQGGKFTRSLSQFLCKTLKFQLNVVVYVSVFPLVSLVSGCKNNQVVELVL